MTEDTANLDVYKSSEQNKMQILPKSNGSTSWSYSQYRCTILTCGRITRDMDVLVSSSLPCPSSWRGWSGSCKAGRGETSCSLWVSEHTQKGKTSKIRKCTYEHTFLDQDFEKSVSWIEHREHRYNYCSIYRKIHPSALVHCEGYQELKRNLLRMIFFLHASKFLIYNKYNSI